MRRFKKTSHGLRFMLMLMALLMIPVGMSAQFSGSGSGTANDPYIITTPVHLNQMRNNTTAYYRLYRDIDLTQWLSNAGKNEWEAFDFSGDFDGNGKKISGLKGHGIFQSLSGTAHDLTLECVLVSTTSGGALAQSISGTVSNVQVSYTEPAQVKCDGFGGMCGKISGATITNCQIDIPQIDATGFNDIGGIAGSGSGATIRECTVNIPSIRGGNQIGGVVGSCNEIASTIENCKVNVSILGVDKLGGIAGEAFKVTLNNNKVTAKIDGNSRLGGLCGLGNLVKGKENFADVNLEAANGKVGGLMGEGFAARKPNGTITFGPQARWSVATSYEYVWWFQQDDYPDLSLYFKDDRVRILSSKTSSFAIELPCDPYYGGELITEDDGINTYSARFISDSYGKGRIEVTIGTSPTLSLNAGILSSSAIGSVKSSGVNCGGLYGRTDGAALTDCIFSGTVTGTDSVAGIANVKDGSFSHCVSIAQIKGNNYVSGMCNGGNVTNCAALNDRVEGLSHVSRASAATDLALAATKVYENGRNISRRNAAADGNSMPLEDAKLRATYAAKGFEFDNTWNSIETESFPYLQAMPAPPTIQTEVVSGIMQAQGRSLNQGTVEIRSNGETVLAQTGNSNTWQANISPLQAGSVLMVRTLGDSLTSSYYSMITVDYKGQGTADDPYLINTASDLANVSGAYYYKITRNIDLAGVSEWQPVNLDGATIDGGGFTLSNLNVRSLNNTPGGLLGSVNNSTIKNLNLTGATNNNPASDYQGLLGGLFTNSSIENCRVEGQVTGHQHVAALTGSLDGGTITSSLADGTVTGTDAVGALAGSSSGSITTSTSLAKVSSVAYTDQLAMTEVVGVGGCVGYNTGSMSDCNNLGDINSLNASLCGGIVGTNMGTVANSYCSGNIKSQGKWVGGIAGYNDGTAAVVTKCVAVSPKIEVTNPQGVVMRIYGGCRNGAQMGEEGDNLASTNMIISVNGVPADVYDDPMNGRGTAEDLLKQTETYSNLGWNMTATWNLDQNNSMPYHPVFGGLMNNDPNAFKIFAANHIVYVGDNIEIPIMMNNPEDITSVQFDLAIPEGFSVATDADGDDLVTLGSRTSSRKHTIQHKLNGDLLRVMIISPQLKTFTGNEGDICKITLHASDAITNGDVTLLFNEALGTGMDYRSIYSRPTSFTLSVLSDVMAADSVKSINRQSVRMPVSLNNHSQIVSFQMDVELPQGVDIATDDNGKYIINPSDRIDSSKFTFAASKMENGKIRILCVSPSNATIDGNEGEIFNLPLKFDETAQAGDYEVKFSGVNLCETNFHNIEVADFSSKAILEIRADVVKGDVNRDKKINTSDVSAIYGLIHDPSNTVLDSWAADMDDNELINVMDATQLTTFVLNGNQKKAPQRRNVRAKAAAYDGPVLYVEPFAVHAGEEVTVNVMLSNPKNEVGGMQFDLYVPAGLKPVIWDDEDQNDYTMIEVDPSSRGKNFTYTTSKQPNGCYRFAGNDFSNASYKGTEGAILSFKLKAESDMPDGVIDAKLDNIVLAFQDKGGWYQPVYPFTILSGNLADVDNITFNGRMGQDNVAAINASLATATQATWIDCRNATLTEISSPLVLGNPNGLSFYASDVYFSTPTINTVIDEICETLKLVDACNCASPENFDANTAIFERQGVTADTWYPVVLPFIPSSFAGKTATLSAATGENYDFRLEAPAAYTPFLLQTSESGNLRLEASLVKIQASGSDLYAEDTFKGGFMKSVTTGAYDLDGTPVTELVPFHAYFFSTSAPKVNVDGTTVINGIFANEQSLVIYNLQGLRLDTPVKELPAGIYIINGKKIRIDSRK